MKMVGVRGIVVIHVVMAAVLAMIEKIVEIYETCAYERSVFYEKDVWML